MPLITDKQKDETDNSVGDINFLNLLPEIRDVEYVGAYVVIHLKPLKVTDQKTIEQLRKSFPEDEFRRSGFYLGLACL